MTDYIKPHQSSGMLNAVALQTLIWEIDGGRDAVTVQKEMFALTHAIATEHGTEHALEQLVHLQIGAQGLITWLLIQLRESVDTDPTDVLRFFAAQVANLDG